MSQLPAWLIAKNATKATQKRLDTVIIAPLVRPIVVQKARPELVQMPEIDAHDYDDYDDAPIWCEDMGNDFAPEGCMISTM